MHEVKRSKFRALYQPSKILLGVIPDELRARPNIIALCFTMTCSYDPPMMAVSFERRNLSFDLMAKAENFVLSVPGESLADGAMLCGIVSGRDADKFELCRFTEQALPYGNVPGISEAIANIELKVVGRNITGDHLTVFGRVLGYHINPDNVEKNLLAIGPNQVGYKLLIRRGLHRIGVIEGDPAEFRRNLDVDRILR